MKTISRKEISKKVESTRWEVVEETDTHIAIKEEDQYFPTIFKKEKESKGGDDE